jgi:hypothetical protein
LFNSSNIGAKCSSAIDLPNIEFATATPTAFGLFIDLSISARDA